MMKKKEVSSAAALLGSRGGKKSAITMTAKEKLDRAHKGAEKRWEKAKAEKEKK